MKRKFFLELTLKEEIVEGRPEFSFLSRRTRTSFLDVLRLLYHAAEKPKISGLVLTLDRLIVGWASLAGLHRALRHFRAKGKMVYCFIEGGGNAEYYLACAADKVFMSPAAGLHLVGLASEVFFFREVLDRFGVEPQLRAEGDFKSAGEMFTRISMSAPSREQLNALLDDCHAEFCRAIAECRGFSQEEVCRKIDGGPYTARAAVAEGLLDGICYPDELENKLRDQIGHPVRRLTARKAYPRDGFVKRLLTWRRLRIAFIDVLGTIVSGESRLDRAGRHLAGAETIGGFLDHARKSRRIRAVIVRINSPGGTSHASDSIWRQISLLSQSKPVVVSLADVAASGGYYVAAAGSRILAESTTVTGSIGVLAGKFVAAELMKRLSIHRECIRRGEHAEFDSPFTLFTNDEAKKLEQHLLEFYREDFVEKVASGRGISHDAVDRAGRGRIWSGLRAKEQGLVDSLGGLWEAVREARSLAGIPEGKKVRQVHYHTRRRLRDLFTPELAPLLSLDPLPHAALEAIEFLNQTGREDLLLWMPFHIRIR